MIEYKECVVCLEPDLFTDDDLSGSEVNVNVNQNENENSEVSTLSDISEIENLYKDCGCKFFIHKECLINWLSTSPSCPMCHKEVYIVDNILIRRSSSTEADGDTETDTDTDLDTDIELGNSRTSKIYECLVNYLSCCFNSMNSRNRINHNRPEHIHIHENRLQYNRNYRNRQHITREEHIHNINMARFNNDRLFIHRNFR